MDTILLSPRSCYEKACQLGKKEGGSPLILDEIIQEKGLKNMREYPLGIMDISLDQIVGSKTSGRKNCFSKSFYPILGIDTEFSSKWIALCKAHLNEGISDPVLVYEYMNEFYVLEGNKRVSVSKYFDTVTISANVIRLIPPLSDQKEIELYYEFMDFYELSKVNYLYFSHRGNFFKLLRLIGKSRNEIWTDDDKLNFNAVFNRFRKEYIKLFGSKHYVMISDAFLSFITVFDYSSLIDISEKDLKAKMAQYKSELELKMSSESSALKLDPSQKKANPILNLVPKHVLKVKVAFINGSSPDKSAWTYNHDLGRIHLEKTFPDNVTTTVYNDVTVDTIDVILEDAIAQKHQVIFATSPIFMKAVLKAAVEHPNIKFLNCTTQLGYKHVRTYFARMYEVKFLMGAIAGAMTENDKVGYIADYPIYGTMANINAFALGAKMVNPRVKVHLKWSRQTRNDDGSDNTLESIYQYYRDNDISIISDKDSLNSKELNQRIGLYRIHYPDNSIWNLAMPVWDWDVFYEKTVSNILDGNWKSEENSDKKKGITYWWGISSELVKVYYSSRLPIGTIRLLQLLKDTIKGGNFNPFTGLLLSQTRVVQTDIHATLSPEQILTMDWLADNVVGSVPPKTELTETAQVLSEFVGLNEGDKVL